jgi:peptidoglycan hydrolase CwlO-like protein
MKNENTDNFEPTNIDGIDKEQIKNDNITSDTGYLSKDDYLESFNKVSSRLDEANRMVENNRTIIKQFTFSVDSLQNTIKKLDSEINRLKYKLDLIESHRNTMLTATVTIILFTIISICLVVTSLLI